jgi:hypothetical protein
MAAAGCELDAATANTWPPDAENPQIASFLGFDIGQAGGEGDCGLPIGEPFL